jgi:pimeloyl-ACP methyl ester carboxylesterase
VIEPQIARPARPPLRFATAQPKAGLRLHYAEHGQPGGEPLVFVHGWPDSWYSYSRLLPLLDPARYQAFAFDLRGFGQSDRPLDGYSIDQLAADTRDFLDAVGLDRATLIGHSMGSFVARRLAELQPERVQRLVLIGSALSPVNDVTLEVQETVQALTDPLPPEFVRDFQASTVHLPVPLAFFEGIVAESLKAPARVWQAAFDGLLAFDDADQLGHITAPTLIMWGEQDALFSSAAQGSLSAAIPNARLKIYPATGHSLQWERPEQVADDLDAYIRAT